MTTKRENRPDPDRPADSRRESGLPGGGTGRTDHVGRSGVYPGSGPYPGADVPVRTPADFVRGQTDSMGRPVEGGSEPTYLGGQTLLGGSTPESSSPPAAGQPERELPARPRKAEAPRPRRRRGGKTTGNRAEEEL